MQSVTFTLPPQLHYCPTSTKAKGQHKERRELVTYFTWWGEGDYCYIPIYFLDMLICCAWVDRSCQYFNIWWGNWSELCWLEYRNWVAEGISPLQAIMTGAFYVISPLFASFKAKKMVERTMCVWQIIVMWLRLVISLYMQRYASCS